METLQTLSSMETLQMLATIAHVIKILFSRFAKFKKTKKGFKISVSFYWVINNHSLSNPFYFASIKFLWLKGLINCS